MEEADRVRGDVLSRSFLIQSLPNDIYASIDCHETGKSMWEEICRLMQGTDKGTQRKKSNLLTKFATFKGREGELLEETYIRFCSMVNELRKNGLKKTNLEINIQFINSLRSEWRRFASNIQQNCDLDEIDIQEQYEMLNHNQDEILEILESEKKISRPVSDPLALVAERRHGQHSRSARVEIDSDIPSDEGEDGSGSESDLHEMKKAIALLSRSLNKKYSRRPTSNNHRFSSSSGKRYDSRERFDPRDK